MSVLNVAFVGSQDLARSLAKLNDTRDIESYVNKEVIDGTTRILSLLRPLKHPERLRPLLSCLNSARCGIVEIGKVDASLGEVLVAFGAAGIEHGHLIIAPEDGGWIDEEQVKVIQKQAGLESWILHPSSPDPHQLKQSLFKLLDELPSRTEDPLVIPIDQHFNVKGVGLVAIGYVQAGSIDKHDKLLALPTEDGGITRSLQVMDDDCETAIAGDRVGVALREMREAAVERGSILVHQGDGDWSGSLIRHDKSRVEVSPAPFQNKRLEEGDVVHGAIDLQFVVGRVTSVDGDTVNLEWDAPLFIRTVSPPRLLLTQLDANMRVIGHSSSVTAL